MPAYVIDLTRLVSRQGHATLTGIDRVELAWLTHLLTLETPLFALVRTAAGVLLLPRAGAQVVEAMARGHLVPDRSDLISRLTRRRNPARGRAEAHLRALALARLPLAWLVRGLRRHLPAGAVYLNLGHSNLTAPMLMALGRAGLRRWVMIHDCIPLDFPQFSRADAPAAFAAKLAAVSAHADRVIHLSHATRAGTEAHLSRLGRVPDSVVAPLGITVAIPDPGALPPGLDLTTPYFVALGTIEPRKNLSLLLDVWDRLAAQGNPPNLFILGSRGWAGAELLARLDARPKGVTELTGLSDGAVSALMRGARALLFPSRAEGFGLPPIEAAALETPVMCSDLPVIREILSDYPVYLNPDDIYSWQETIMTYVGRDTQKAQVTKPVLPDWQQHFRNVLTSA